jgi:polysaccharide deacetylase 2 family uncharacterized protein YibQ
MSKKRQNQQLILSVATIFLISVITTLFYFIDQAIDEDDISTFNNIKVLDKNESIQNSEFKFSDLESAYQSEINGNNNYLSEIKDLHDNLQKEFDDTNDNEIVEISSVHLKPQLDILENRTDVAEEIEKKEDLPKLAIIIDDVAFKYQFKRLKKLDLPLTLSFFPADINHHQTTEFAKHELVPMIHFPLEAQNFKSEEIDTLHVGDSEETIESRVSQLATQFSNVRFTNNHTGSKFTSDYASMRALLKALKKHNIQFIDSVTTSKSVVKSVSKELGVRYIRRDIFIDNKLDVNLILDQLKSAIRLAKKRGYAVAIGHPHKATIKALSNLKPLLDGVQLVYINDI